MKVFLITWGLLCFLVIVGLLIAYTTDKLPGVSVAEPVALETTGECSPCEENIARIKEAMEQTQKTSETFYLEQTDENLEQFKKTLETFDRELSALERAKNKAADGGQSPDSAP